MIDKREMQYLYDTDEALVFMDNETYEQIEIAKERLKWEINFLKANDNVNISMYESEILGIILPDKVALRVVECEPAVKGDTATAASKNAVVESGLEVKVPLFISQDEIILINTSDGKYSGRAERLMFFKTMREQNYRIVLFSYKNADNDTKAAAF